MPHFTRLAGLALIAALGLSALPTASHAQRVSMEEAEKRCYKRLSRFAQTPRGMAGDLPDPQMIRMRYRQCIHGYTGQDPRSYPNFSSKLFDLQKLIERVSHA